MFVRKCLKYDDFTYSWIVKNDRSFELAKSNIVVHNGSVCLETRMYTAYCCSDSLWTIWQTIIWSHDNQSNKWFWLSVFKCIIITKNMVMCPEIRPFCSTYASAAETTQWAAVKIILLSTTTHPQYEPSDVIKRHCHGYSPFPATLVPPRIRAEIESFYGLN